MDDAPADAPARRGRPRDPRVEGVVAEAVRELLAEHGYAALTIKAVAERSGTSVPTIYRRWTAKPELVFDVVFRDAITAVPLAGELEVDVRTLVEVVLGLFGDPAGRAALAGLVSESSSVGLEVLHRWWSQLTEVVAAAASAGQVRDDVDVDVVLAALLGPTLVAAFTDPVAGRSPDAVVEQVTRLTLDAVRPQPGPASS